MRPCKGVVRACKSQFNPATLRLRDDGIAGIPGDDVTGDGLWVL
jgi:hypothetical protein